MAGIYQNPIPFLLTSRYERVVIHQDVSGATADPQVPLGELIEVTNEATATGRIRTAGHPSNFLGCSQADAFWECSHIVINGDIVIRGNGRSYQGTCTHHDYMDCDDPHVDRILGTIAEHNCLYYGLGLENYRDHCSGNDIVVRFCGCCKIERCGSIQV